MVKNLVDTHIHVWDLDKAGYPWLKGDTSILNQSWSIDQLEKERQQAGVTAGILVQASGNKEDTDLMLATARQTSWIKGVVAWLPLMKPSLVQQQLDDIYLNEKYFKGVRHQVHDEPDAQWLLQPRVIESLKILAKHDIPYDLVGIRNEHMETLVKVLEQVPTLRVVLDHLNQPPIKTKERFGKWGELMTQLAQHPTVYAKISGLGTASGNFAGWTIADIEPYIHFAIEKFGTDRCFCGGDWPVALLAGSYVQVWDAYKKIVSGALNEVDQEKIFSGNAIKFYNLDL
ncbi:MAG TPA: amidohydrolase family protein [Chitinophagaceae bacterium]|jgi:L-fuconolactonase|nr:amidohydrolase family protein [Chitinophagaceae bacterium]